MSETGYLHGYTASERERLHRQARFLEPAVHDRLPFRRRRRLIEVGAGVGAQTEILLRHFPELYVTGVEINDAQIAEARRFLATVPWATGRYDIVKGDVMRLDFEPESFDCAFLCWILEHVSDPARVLGEVRRVLNPGAPIVCSEVLNATFFLDPYSPNTMRYWMAYNDHQLSLRGDPFVGAKLGNLLQSVGFRDVQTDVRSFHLDNRAPGERAEFLSFWTELLLSGAPSLIAAEKISQEVVDGMTEELARVGRDPNSVFFTPSSRRALGHGSVFQLLRRTVAGGNAGARSCRTSQGRCPAGLLASVLCSSGAAHAPARPPLLTRRAIS